MILEKLRYKDIPDMKKMLRLHQDETCPICHRTLTVLKSRDICLDHNHDTGRVRAVLCRSCNAIEGKVKKLFIRMGLRKAGINYEKYLESLKDYNHYPETQYIHPKYKIKKVKK